MICSQCSHENADDYLFCENCGERLGKECPECGHANGHDFAFCENCGHKFAAEPEYVPASEELEPEATPNIPTTKKKEAISTPVPVEAIPVEAAPAAHVVASQQEEKRRRLPGWLWPAVGLLAIIGFIIIFGPRQPDYQPVASSSGNSSSSGQSSDNSGNTSSSGQSSGNAGNTSSSGQSNSSEGNTSSSGQSNDDSEGDSDDSGPTFTADQETNCRYGPSASDFDVRRTVFNGQTVPIVGNGTAPAQEWWVLVVDGVQCWVWSGLGEVNGNTASLVSINPPPIPVAEAEQDEPEPDREEEEQQDGGLAEQCISINPSTTVDPQNGPIPTVYTINVAGYLPEDELTIYVRADVEGKGTMDIIFTGTFVTDTNGNGVYQLVSEEGDVLGHYNFLFSSSTCVDFREFDPYLHTEGDFYVE